MNTELTFKPTIRDRFNEFHRDNPHVYKLYEHFAFELIGRGHKRLGSKMIIERIRWETMIKTTDETYKISNDFTALYAREFVKNHPQHADKFVFKSVSY